MDKTDGKIWLVDIKLLTRAASLSSKGTHVTYEEVLASSEKDALDVGYVQFCKKAQYEPATRLKLKNLCLSAANCYAAEVVEV